MKEDKIKIIFDKIMIGIFTILCFMAFFLVVFELPGFLNELFNTTVFQNTKYICFFACAALLGYAMNYYEKKRDEEKFKIISKHSDEMIGLNNFWKLYDYETTAITNKEITSFFKIKLVINDQYSVEIPIELFKCINGPKDLTKFDNYINTNFKENNEKQKLILEMQMRDMIEDYLKKYASENNK